MDALSPNLLHAGPPPVTVHSQRRASVSSSSASSAAASAESASSAAASADAPRPAVVLVDERPPALELPPSPATGLLAGGTDSGGAGVVHGKASAGDAAATFMFVPAISNLSVQYNFADLSPAIVLMTACLGAPCGAGQTADFPEPAWAGYVELACVFVGAMVGMIGLGFLADVVGRRKGMVLTLSLVVLGALLSALIPWGSPDAVYGLLAAARFVLGVGVGGIYPMAAAAAHEGTHTHGASAEAAVGWTFWWQAPGALLPYLLALALVQAPAGAGTSSWQFRVLLGVGALVALPPLIAAVRQLRGDVGADGMRVAPKPHVHRPMPGGLFGRRNRRHWLTLLGTGVPWMLYDIAFYGTGLFAPVILKNISGSTDLQTLLGQSAIIQAIGLPAAALTILLLRPCGARLVSIVAFFFLAATYAALAIAVAAGASTNVQYGLFCLISAAVWAPNVTTYILPAAAYPPSVRCTFHGLSAACGKLGAIIGTFLFVPIDNSGGLVGIMWTQFSFSLLGGIFSLFFLPYAPTPDEPGEGLDECLLSVVLTPRASVATITTALLKSPTAGGAAGAAAAMPAAVVPAATPTAAATAAATAPLRLVSVAERQPADAVAAAAAAGDEAALFQAAPAAGAGAKEEAPAAAGAAAAVVASSMAAPEALAYVDAGIVLSLDGDRQPLHATTRGARPEP